MSLKRLRFRAIIAVFSLAFTILPATQAPALSFNSVPATQWGYIYGSGKSQKLIAQTPTPRVDTGKPLSKWNIEFVTFHRMLRQLSSTRLIFGLHISNQTFQSRLKFIGNHPLSMAFLVLHVRATITTPLMARLIKTSGTHLQ